MCEATQLDLPFGELDLTFPMCGERFVPEANFWDNLIVPLWDVLFGTSRAMEYFEAIRRAREAGRILKLI